MNKCVFIERTVFLYILSNDRVYEKHSFFDFYTKYSGFCIKKVSFRLAVLDNVCYNLSCIKL